VRVTGPGSMSIAPGLTAHFGIGDHFHYKPGQQDNMLLIHLDAGGDGSFYHLGDNSNFEKTSPGARPDAVAFHVQVGLDVAKMIDRVKPRLAIGAHVLELGHPPHEYRWQYQTAIDELRCVDPSRAIVPVWGERYRIR
jgi:hypothetical protein